MVVAQIPKFLGFVYALVVFLIAAFLWYSRRWNRSVMYTLLVVTIILGFVILAPIMPYQFQLLVLGQTETLGAPLASAGIGLVVLLALTSVLGRHYCGYLCPVGAVSGVFRAPFPLRHTGLFPAQPQRRLLCVPPGDPDLAVLLPAVLPVNLSVRGPCRSGRDTRSVQDQENGSLHRVRELRTYLPHR
jgi:hypothetical protein